MNRPFSVTRDRTNHPRKLSAFLWQPFLQRPSFIPSVKLPTEPIPRMIQTLSFQLPFWPTSWRNLTLRFISLAESSSADTACRRTRSAIRGLRQSQGCCQRWAVPGQRGTLRQNAVCCVRRIGRKSRIQRFTATDTILSSRRTSRLNSTSHSASIRSPIVRMYLSRTLWIVTQG